MADTRLRGKGQLTLPREIREAAHLEDGDPLCIELVEEGILLRPQKMIDASQAWFWTPEWQAGERRATADIEAGRMTTYDTDEDFLTSLEG
jgi:antitoxin PrlF